MGTASQRWDWGATERFGGRGRIQTSLLVLLWLIPLAAQAARPSELAPADFWHQAAGFFDFSKGYIRTQWTGVILMGICCGMLGTFIVVRRTALVGDMLSHAVLPGIVLGFLWNLRKEPVSLLAGAIVAGLAGTALVTALGQTTRLKRDAALGIVLGGFYAIGVCLLSMVQRMEAGDKSGLSTILMGSAAAISEADIWLIGMVTVTSLGIIVLLFKELVASSFDPGFARSVGIPERSLHYLLMALLSFAVVISVQAVGVVLVSALLIIPAATASLLTHRMAPMIGFSMIFGMISAIGGAFASFLPFSSGAGRTVTLPTGPAIILAAAFLFGAAYLFSPEHGLVVRQFRRRAQSARIQRENTLKAIFQLLETAGFDSERVSLAELARRRHRTPAEARFEVQNLVRYRLAEVDGDEVRLTSDGWRRAREIVRNHRLWELYLTHSADIAPDHVHDDAEKIEHVLGEEVVRLLEARFGAEALDPHGREIPQADGTLSR